MADKSALNWQAVKDLAEKEGLRISHYEADPATGQQFAVLVDRRGSARLKVCGRYHQAMARPGVPN